MKPRDYAELEIQGPGDKIQRLMLEDDRYVLGREGSKELRYPELGNL